MKTPIIIGLCCLLTLLTVMFLQAQTRGQENGAFTKKASTIKQAGQCPHRERHGLHGLPFGSGNERGWDCVRKLTCTGGHGHHLRKVP